MKNNIFEKYKYNYIFIKNMLSHLLEFDDSILEVKIGQNAQENWDIISNSSQNDIWFHLGCNLSSPHVVLKNPNRLKIPKRILSECAILCKNNSKYNNIKKIAVIYTEIKNVTKGDTVGSVHTKKTNEIII